MLPLNNTARTANKSTAPLRSSIGLRTTCVLPILRCSFALNGIVNDRSTRNSKPLDTTPQSSADSNQIKTRERKNPNAPCTRLAAAKRSIPPKQDSLKGQTVAKQTGIDGGIEGVSYYPSGRIQRACRKKYIEVVVPPPKIPRKRTRCETPPEIDVEQPSPKKSQKTRQQSITESKDTTVTRREAEPGIKKTGVLKMPTSQPLMEDAIHESVQPTGWSELHRLAKINVADFVAGKKTSIYTLGDFCRDLFSVWNAMKNTAGNSQNISVWLSAVMDSGSLSDLVLPEESDFTGFSLGHLYHLFLLVIAEGGFSRVNRNRKWDKFAADFRRLLGLPKQTTFKTIAAKLKKIYLLWLRRLETSIRDDVRTDLTLPKLRAQVYTHYVADQLPQLTTTTTTIPEEKGAGFTIDMTDPALFREQVTVAPRICLGLPVSPNTPPTKMAKCPMAQWTTQLLPAYHDLNNASCEATTTAGSSAEDSDYI